MNKKGKQISNGVIYAGMFFVGIIALILVLSAFGVIHLTPASQNALGGGLTTTEQAEAIAKCGDNKVTAVSLTLKNGLNTNTAETFDASYLIYQINTDEKNVVTETQVASGVNTTGDSVNLDCGNKYRLKLVTDGSADNSRITGVYTANAKVDTDGSIVFVTTAPSLTLGMIGSVHSTIEVRAYNEDARARMYATDGSNSAYQPTGVVFWSTSDNTTNTTVTAGSSMLMTLEMKAINTTTDFNDYGVLVMFDASTTYWDKVQQITFDGVALSDVKGDLDANERKATANYEYVFEIPAGVLIDGKNHKLYFDVLKSSGATGSDNLKVDFAVRGNYLSVDGFSIKTGAYRDLATSPILYSLFNTNIQTE